MMLTRPEPPTRVASSQISSRVASSPISPLVAPPPISPERHSLFIDFDGTLVDLIDRPDRVRADGELLDLLAGLHARFGGRLALVSGRSIEQLDAMIGPALSAITLAGSHGSEIRIDGDVRQPPRAAGLDAAIIDVVSFAALHPQLIVETKSHGVAIHYRAAPSIEQVVALAASAIASRHALALQPGKMMIELRGPGGDKGDAIAVLMRQPGFVGSLPVMIGDDLTDEPALAIAAELGGFGILVGERGETAALYTLSDVGDVRRWLWEMAR